MTQHFTELQNIGLKIFLLLYFQKAQRKVWGKVHVLTRAHTSQAMSSLLQDAHKNETG